MRIASLYFFLVFSTSAVAGSTQAWEFVYVVRSTTLEASAGRGDLIREGSRLSGLLTASGTLDYRVEIEIRGTRASATFGAIESDDGGTMMTGSFVQSQIPGDTGCWQTFQLNDGYSSLGLARNIPVCEIHSVPAAIPDGSND